METPKIIVIDEFTRTTSPYNNPVARAIQVLAKLDESSDRH